MKSKNLTKTENKTQGSPCYFKRKINHIKRK